MWDFLFVVVSAPKSKFVGSLSFYVWVSTLYWFVLRFWLLRDRDFYDWDPDLLRIFLKTFRIQKFCRRRDTKPHVISRGIKTLATVRESLDATLIVPNKYRRGFEAHKSNTSGHPTALLSQRLCFWFSLPSTWVRTPPQACTVVKNIVVAPEKLVRQGCHLFMDSLNKSPNYSN